MLLQNDVISRNSNSFPYLKRRTNKFLEIEMQDRKLGKNLAYRRFINLNSRIKFWELVPKATYPQLKTVWCRFISSLGTTQAVDHCIARWGFKSEPRIILVNQVLKEFHNGFIGYKPDFRSIRPRI